MHGNVTSPMIARFQCTGNMAAALPAEVFNPRVVHEVK